MPNSELATWVSRSMHSEEAAQAATQQLPMRLLRELAALRRTLPPAEGVVALGHPAWAEALAERGGERTIPTFGSRDLLGGQVLRGRQVQLEQSALRGIDRVVLASDVLHHGLRVMETVLLLRSAGIEVLGLACLLEFSSQSGRTRAELIGVPVRAALKLAGTPRGLIVERRTPSDLPEETGPERPLPRVS